MWGGSLIHLLLVVGLVVLVINLLSGRRSAVSKKGTTSPSTRRSRCSLPPASGPFQPHARSARGALPPNCQQNATRQLINVLAAQMLYGMRESIKLKMPEGTGGPMSRGKLSKQEIAAGLCKLDGWSVVKGNLHRMFEFKDFKEIGRAEGTGGPMSRGKLSKQEIAAGLCKLDGWSVVKGNLHRMFEFKDFKQAF